VARGAPGAHSRFTVVLPHSFFFTYKERKAPRGAYPRGA